MKLSKAHYTFIDEELTWLEDCMRQRIQQFKDKKTIVNFEEKRPALPKQSPYGDFIREHDLGTLERLALALSYGYTFRVRILNQVLDEMDNIITKQLILEAGIYQGVRFKSFIPTVNTLFFLLADEHYDSKIPVREILSSEHVFYAKNIFRFAAPPEDEPHLGDALFITDDWKDYLLDGRHTAPKFSSSFPARRITTKLNWEDLILREKTREGIQDIIDWMNLQHTLKEEYTGRHKSVGYRALFFGPPGTGKTISAALIGKLTDTPVYRVDISMIVDKYIGETETHLSNLLDKAESKGWILFFDEGDALFGKRVDNVQSSSDSHGNQVVSYLLQRIETYDGILLVATNHKINMDSAYMRRFDGQVQFQLQEAEERFLLWHKMLPHSCSYADDVDIVAIAANGVYSAAVIGNIVYYATIQAAKVQSKIITKAMLYKAINREDTKDIGPGLTTKVMTTKMLNPAVTERLHAFIKGGTSPLHEELMQYYQPKAL